MDNIYVLTYASEFVASYRTETVAQRAKNSYINGHPEGSDRNKAAMYTKVEKAQLGD